MPASRTASLQELWGLIWRRRLSVLAWTLALLIAAAAYLEVAPRLYTASTSILLDPTPPASVLSEPAAPPQAPDPMMVESQVRVASSDAVLHRVVASQKLADDPEFTSDRPGLRARLLSLLGIRPVPPAYVAPETRATAALARRVAVNRSERTYILDVSVTSLDPDKAAQLARAMAAAYLEDQRSNKDATISAQSTYLTARLDDLRARLEEAENKVEAYKSQNRIFDPNGKLTEEQQLSDLNAELARAQIRSAQAQAKVQQLQRMLAAGQIPDSTDDALRSPTLERLRAQYAEIARQQATYRATLGSRHPALIQVEAQLRDVRGLIREELKRIVDAASNEERLARAAESEIRAQVEMASALSSKTNQSLVRLRDLQRDVDANRATYERFLRLRENVRDIGADAPTARVIAPALVPISPSSPKRLAILFLALAAGLGLGIGQALIRGPGEDDRLPLEPRLRQRTVPSASPAPPPSPPPPPRPLDKADTIPLIGTIPLVSPKSSLPLPDWLRRFGRSHVAERDVPASMLSALADAPNSDFAAAVRSLRDELRTTTSGRPVGVVLITSQQPGAGKTTIAVNLARAAAERGERALVIDANHARPALAHLVTPEVGRGLIRLVGTTRPLYRIGTGGTPLFIVPIVTDEASVVGRLSRDSSIKTLDGIKSNFDFVVIDGPSIEDDRSARLIAEAADQIVVVTPAGAEPKSAAQALDTLQVPNWKRRGTVRSMIDGKAAA